MVSIPIIETVVEVVIYVLTYGGYPGIVLLMFFESFGIPPLPSEIILPFTGFLVVTGALTFGGALAAAMVGGLLGSYAGYAVGRWGRHWITSDRLGRLRLKPEYLERMDRWFVRWGEGIVGGARLLPVVRSYVSYPAGTSKMNPVRFGVYTALGALPFTTALIYAGMLLRQNWNALVPYFNVADYIAVVVLVGFIVWVLVRWRRESRHVAPEAMAAPPGRSD